MSQYYRSHSAKDKPTHINWPRKGPSDTRDMNMRVGTAVILTAEGISYQAICAHLDNLREEVYRGTVYERGTFSTGQQTWEIGLVEMGQGGTTASFETERALSYFKPDVLLYISLATGIQDVQLGDVVSTTKAYAYESGKSTTTFEARPAVWSVSYEMEQRARAEARRTNWLNRVKEQTSNSTSNVVLAPIAAGEKVIASTQSKLYPFLLSHYNDAVAVEMGGHGVLVAAHAHSSINALVVCGISELIQNDLKNERQENATQRRRVAAQHASAFAFEVLANLVPPPIDPPKPVVKKDVPKPPVIDTKPAPEKDTPSEIFYSYATKDKQLAEQLQQQLFILELKGLITNWDRYKVAGGADLEERQRHLDTASIIVLLVSPAYIVSPYYEDEAKRAMTRRAEGKATVIPILLRSTPGWEHTYFSGLQVIPRDGKAITQFANRDQAWSEVALEIGTIIESLKKNK